MTTHSINGTEWVVTERVGQVTEDMIQSAMIYGSASGSTGSTWEESDERGTKGRVTMTRADRMTSVEHL